MNMIQKEEEEAKAIMANKHDSDDVDHDEDEDEDDRFPAGMRVLAIDADPVSLEALGTLLLQCQYQVIKSKCLSEALNLLREYEKIFDIIITDTKFKDMDPFKLLEIIRLEFDTPVIMMSSCDDKKLVMKGIIKGACGYLLKPIRVEELKIIWQHVIPKRDPKSKKNGDYNEAKLERKQSEEEQEQDKEEEEHVQEDNNERKEKEKELHQITQKKTRVVWCAELHRKFVAAINELGLNNAVPKNILELMNVENLSRENVASHLQKYRIYLKRSGLQHQSSMGSILSCNDRSPYWETGSCGQIGNVPTFAGPGHYENNSMAFGSYPPSQRLSRLSSPSVSNQSPIQTHTCSRILQVAGNSHPAGHTRSHSVPMGMSGTYQLDQQKPQHLGSMTLLPVLGGAQDGYNNPSFHDVSNGSFLGLSSVQSMRVQTGSQLRNVAWDISRINAVPLDQTEDSIGELHYVHHDPFKGLYGLVNPMISMDEDIEMFDGCNNPTVLERNVDFSLIGQQVMNHEGLMHNLASIDAVSNLQGGLVPSSITTMEEVQYALMNLQDFEGEG